MGSYSYNIHSIVSYYSLGLSIFHRIRGDVSRGLGPCPDTKSPNLASGLHHRSVFQLPSRGPNLAVRFVSQEIQLLHFIVQAAQASQASSALSCERRISHALLVH